MEPLTLDINIQTIKQLIKSNSYHNINIQTVKQLIESNNYRDINNKYGICEETLLHHAAYYNHIEIVKYLVSVASNGSGASIDAFDNNHNTPLRNASLVGNLDIVKFLIKSGANVNLADIDGQTPLHSAVADGLDECGYNTATHDGCRGVCNFQHLNTDTIKYLIEAGAPIDLGDYDGNTALHLASKHNIEFVKCLLDHGADASCKTQFYGNTAEQVAIICHKPEIAEYIRSYRDIPTKGVHA